MVRQLNCLKNGEQDCLCNHCVRIRDLNFEGLIFLSRRNYNHFLKESIISYKKNKDKVYLNNIIRIIKMVSLPLQDFLVKDSFNELEKKQISNLLKDVGDIIYKDEISSYDLENIEEIIQKILAVYKTLNIPVNCIRGMLDWTYISQPDINRVVIIDHVDYLEKSSQNILLKRLEEPSSNLYFILIAKNKNRIVQTILSRCRCYYFKELSKENANIITQKNFGESCDYNSLNNFLLRNDETSRENIFPILIKLLNLVFLKEAPFSELSIFLGAYKDRKYVKSMLYELGALVEKEVLRRQTGVIEETDLKMLKHFSYMNLILLNSIITKKFNDIDKYGLNPVRVLEGIFYPLKAMVQND